MARVHVICGAVHSQRSARLDTLFAENPERTLLLTPSRAYAARRRDHLIVTAGLPGIWGNFAYQMTDFARELVAKEGIGVSLLDDTFKRLLLVQQCLDTLAPDGPLELLDDAAQGSGLTRHLLEVINRLKQTAIEPDDFRKRTEPLQHHNPFHELVAVVYEAYQHALKEAGAYDVPGLYWEAVLRCEKGEPAALRDVDVLILDGFDDFTPSEFRFIAGLEAHVGTLVFGLNYDEAPGRQDLYTLPKKTFDQIRRDFDVVYEHLETPAPDSYVTYVANNLFWRDPPRCPEDIAPNLDIVCCTHPEEEIHHIARQIKSLILDEGVSTNAIAVVYRNLGRNAPALRAVFGEFGIPLRTTAMPTLNESAVARFLLTLLSAITSWSRDAVIDTISAPWFNPNDLPSLDVHAIPLLVRNARIVSGQREWRVRLQALLLRLERGHNPGLGRLLDRIPEATIAVKGLIERVALLDDFRKTVPTKDSIAAYALALGTLLEKLGIDLALDEFGDEALAEKERSALIALRKLLASLAESPTENPMMPNDFIDLLKQGISETTFPYANRNGGVTAEDPSTVRNLQFAYIFFAGLNEGETPTPPVVNAIYAEGDLDQLRQKGIALEGHREHSARERLLFHHVIAAATEKLCLTYSLTKNDGREAELSAYLEDIATLFPDEIHTQMQGTPPALGGDLRGVTSLRDLRNTALFDLRGNPSEKSATPPENAAASLFRPECEVLLHAAHVQARRNADTPFDAYDGALGDPALLEKIAQDYGSEHVFSVAQLETYTKCPFHFFIDRLLKIEEEVEVDGELEPIVHGQILHRVLQRAHEKYRGMLLANVAPQEATDTLDTLVEEEFSKIGWRDTAATPAVLAVEAARMKATLSHFLNAERTHEEKQAEAGMWQPKHFELAFGNRHGESADPLSTEAPFILKTRIGPVRFAGRIDRVDVAPSGSSSVRIIDYKSSKGAIPKAADIKQGTSMQLTLYTWAIEQHLLAGDTCLEAHFVSVGKRGRIEALYKVKDKKKSEDRVENALGAICAAIEGIRAGHFPPLHQGNKCYGCGHAHVCRYDKNRIARKLSVADDLRTAPTPDKIA